MTGGEPGWRSTRPALATYYEDCGGRVTDNAAVLERDGAAYIARLQDRRGAAAFDEILDALPNRDGDMLRARAQRRGEQRLRARL